MSYDVGNYEGTLVIDPSLVWATYFGGNNDDFPNGLTTDASGNLYIVGETSSTSNIATTGAYQISFSGNALNPDAFIAKFNNSCSRIWATYYGGSGTVDRGESISSDGNGNVYITGYTFSTSAIASVSAYQTIYGGGNGDAFIAKFNTLGQRQWATYYGGSGSESAFGISSDAQGYVYIIGHSNSTFAISSSNAYQAVLSGSYDAFIAKFDSLGQRQWATYYGGSGVESGRNISLDGQGNVYIAGNTNSTSAIASVGAFQTIIGGGNDVFIAKFDSLGQRQWASYYGGSGTENEYGISSDALGNVYITGNTNSTSSVASIGAYQTVNSGNYDAFIAKFNGSGQRQWSTYFGGSGGEESNGISNDVVGNVYIIGNTSSSSSIASVDAYQTVFHGGTYDAFFAKFDILGQRQWGSYFGGTGYEIGKSVALDALGNIYISGYTGSSAGITSAGAYQTVISGAYDAFLARFNFGLVANAGPDASICLGNSTQLGTYSQANHYYSWTSNPSGYTSTINNPFVSPTVTTTYYLKDSVTGSISGFDTVVVTVNPLPTINAGADVSVCVGNNITLNAITNASYLSWNNGVVNNQSFIPSFSGNYIATATTTQFCVKKDTVVVTINPLPIVNGGADAVICAGTNITLTASGAVNYLWSGGINNTQSFVPVTNTNYVVTGTDSNGCINKDTVVVIVNSMPATPIISGSFCIDTTLTATPTNGVQSLQWKLNGTTILTSNATYGINGTTEAGNSIPSSGASNLYYPMGVFVDVNNNIYVSDRDNNRIQKWVPGATSGITVAGGNGLGNNANQLYSPYGVFVDGLGNVYACDHLNSRIQKWAPGATSGITVAGGNGAGAGANQLNTPIGVFVDVYGNIYVCDRVNYRIQKWGPGATSGITVAGGNGFGSAMNQLNDPRGVYLDANGNIYVCDYGNHRIQKWIPGATNGITVAGGNGQGSAANQLSYPQGVFVDGNGNVYVSDQNNHRIQKWAPGATTGVTIIGGNGWSSSSNGLNFPTGVYVDGNGSVYVSDCNNHRIQKWNMNSIANNLSNTTLGTYTVTANSIYGCSATSSPVVVHSLPQVNAGSNQTVCIGDLVTLNASGANTYSWNNGVLNNLPFTPNSTNSYFVIGTDSFGCTNSDTVIVTINPLPTVSAGTDQNICLGNSTTLSATGAVNYSWSGGINNNQSFTPTTTNSYIVTGTDANGCSNKDTVQVTVNLLPTAITITTNSVICPNGNATLTASGGTSYLWSNGDTATTTTVNQVGNYYVVAANQYGCTDTSNIITITQKPLPNQVKIKAVGATSVCEPNTVAFVLDMPLGSTTGFAYQWYLSGSAINGATDSTFNANTTGSYALSVSGGDNCLKYSTAKTATIKAAPVASFAPITATTICAGGLVTLVAPSISGCTYTWLKDGVAAGTGSTKTFKLAGNYTVVAKLNGCSDTASPALPITVNPLPVAAVAALNATTFCAGDSCTITASPVGAVSYEWHNGTFILDTTTSEQFKIGITATIKVLVKDANGCIGKLSSTIVKTKANAIPLASISSNGSTTISSTGNVKLKATPSAGVTWQWYKDGNILSNATANTYTATSGGSYTVAITKTGCTGTSTPVVVTQTTPKQETATTTFHEGSFEMSAYPNPVNDVLTVTISGIETIDGTIQVMDVLGRVVASTPLSDPTTGNCQLNTANWSSGVYFIRYKDNEGRTGTVKVVKE